MTTMPTTDVSTTDSKAVSLFGIQTPENKVSVERTNRSIQHLHVLLLVVGVMVLITVLLSAVIAIKLGQMQQEINRAQHHLSRNIEETIRNLKINHQLNGLLNTSTSTVLRSGPSSGTLLHSEPKCPWKCTRKDFPMPPLVILSMDGFSRGYLKRVNLSSLNYLAKCGATTERVYPSFPSRTFPNHYTIVTGLYPESHGIVDNDIYDAILSNKMESMKSTKVQGFYLGDPIWNVYKRYGGRTACLFWPGCAYNISGSRPDISIPYNKSLPFRKRADMIVDWLLLSQQHRPGLITAYFDEPDGAGHYQKDFKDIEFALSKVDELLWHLIYRLHKEDLLQCINLAVVSDHGMQNLNFTTYFSDMLTDKNIVIAAGAVSRIHMHKSALTVEQLMKPFECKRGDKWKVYDRTTMATRKHYQKTSRVGDIIVQGELGTRFYQDPSKNWKLTGDHGYDYINPTMQTIFYAMGPSIKKGSFIPAFQNVEYMNLWLNLLGLPENVPNNGTFGIMDKILVHAPFRPTPFYVQLLECLPVNLTGAYGCRSCSSEHLSLIEWRLSCTQPPRLLVKITSTTPRCFQNYCEKLVISGLGTDDSAAIAERLIRGQSDMKSPCTFANRKYGACTNRGSFSGFTTRTLSASKSDFANISPIVFLWRNGFVSDILDPLNAYTQSLVDRMGQVISITGTACDYDYDGIADKKTSSLPSHLYRVLISCLGEWSSDGIFCLNPAETIVLSFIFPHIEKDLNCLKPKDLLLDYTARLLDVELISGLRLQFPNLSNAQSLQLKTHISMSLW